jgi:hypothetical protein
LNTTAIDLAPSSRDYALMIRNTTLLFVAVLAAFSIIAFAADKPAAENKKGALYHVVSLKFKPSAGKDDIVKVEQAFAALKEKIPGITSLNWGTNVSPEKLDKGFTHCFVLTFNSEKDRDAYLPHPEHKAFGQLLGPVLQDAFVIDFWAK